MAKGERVEGQGAHDAKIIVVGEAPGQTEEENGIPFCGPSGRLLDRFLLDAGIRRSECYLTNVVKYRPPFNNLRKLGDIGHSIEEGIPQLWQEIAEISPNVILALGNLSLKILTGKGTGFSGILNYRGSVLPSVNLDCKVLSTIHPAAFLHAEGGDEGAAGAISYQMRHIVAYDFQRLKEQSEFKEYRPPDRRLEIIRSVVGLERFLDLYKNERIVSVDIETVYGIPVCIALAFNEWHAASVPLLDILTWQNQEGIPETHLAMIWKILAQLFIRPEIKVIGQNFKFDHAKLQDICGIRITNVYCDNMMLAHSLHCEFQKSQGFLASIYTEEPYYKDEGREFDWKKDKVDRLLLYNAKDAAVAFEIYLRLIESAKEMVVPGFPNWLDDFFFGYVMKLHPLYMDLEEVGIKTDNGRRQELIETYDLKIKVSQMELDSIAGWPVNVSSPKAVPKLLYDQFGLPKRKGADEDTLVALQANSCKNTGQSRAIELILHIRRLRKAKGTYFEAKPDYDGRMRTSVRVCGTETGRSSNSILKPPLRPEKIGLAFQTMTKHGETGSELRSYFTADPGYSFVEMDLSQAEARIVALLGKDDKTLKLFADKVDLHRLTASWIFAVAFEKVTAEFRFIGKTTRHAGNYDMGKRRLMQIVNTDAKKFGIDISISEWQAGQILDKFHKFSPAIRGVFHPEIRRAIDSDRFLVNPFGRYRKFFGRGGDDLYREAYAHIPQSTVPDHLRRAGLSALGRFREDKVLPRFIGGKTPFVIESHDAFLGLVPDEYVDRYIEIMNEELTRPIDFKNCTLSRGMLVIPAEAKVGKNYKECKVKGCARCVGMHDYRLAA